MPMDPRSPLTEQEVRTTAGLLQRAIKFSQERAVLQCFVHQPGMEKSLAVTCDTVMRDARSLLGKRQSEAAHVSEAASSELPSEAEYLVNLGIGEYHSDSDWDRVSMASAVAGGKPISGSYVGEASVPPPMPSTTENTKIPIPHDCGDVIKWGKSQCMCEKYRKEEYTYAQMVRMSSSDTDMYSYLSYIMKKYGTNGTGNLPEKITPAVDLATYLERIQFQGTSKGMAFQRVLK